MEDQNMTPRPSDGGAGDTEHFMGASTRQRTVCTRRAQPEEAGGLHHYVKANAAYG